MTSFDVPGYDVQARIGAGATAEVWRALDRATGDVVALKRPRTDGDAVLLRHEAEVLAGLTSPYVVRLRAVVGDVLVLDHAAGGSLADLLGRRGALEPGEVVTIASPIASALAAVHAAGLVHGDVSPANVLFTADGMPLLSDLGGAHPPGRARVLRATAEYVDPVVAGGGPPGASSDVWALGALCHHLLTGEPPFVGESVDEVLSGAVAGRRAPLGLLAPGATRALVAVVEAALSVDPERRPAAEALATALLRAQAAQPVRLQGPRTSTAVPPLRETHLVQAPPPAPEEPGRHRRGPAVAWSRVRAARPSGAALVGSVTVAALVAVGLSWALAGGRPTTGLPALSPTPSRSVTPALGPSRPPGSSPAGPTWSAVLTGLDGTRAQAFEQGDADLLARVYTPDAPALSADRSAVAGLAASRQTASGVRHDLRAVRQSSLVGDRAELVVTDVLGPQTVRGADGAVVGTHPGRPATTYALTLARRDGVWLIDEVGPAG